MVEQTSSHLAANVRRLREKQGLTQQELADVSGVPRPTIANLESGTANPTLSVLLKVADSLAVSVEDLVRAAAGRSLVHRARSLPERRRGGAAVRRLIPGGARSAEFERIELSPGAKLGIRPDSLGRREVLACETGDVLLSAAGDALPLAAGDVATLDADQPRQYVNRGKRTAIVYRVLVTAPAAS